MTTTQSDEYNVMAVLALVFTFIFPLLGFIFGLIALSQLKKKPHDNSKTMAMIATIVSGIFLFIAILFILFFIGIMVAAISAGATVA